jgi:hypothetical protein
MRAVIARTVIPCFLFTALVAGCSGPPAPDAAVCQDLIHRICLAPRCPGVDTALNVGNDCEAQLLARTGCGSDGFAFSQPTRQEVLQCRVPLLRGGNAPEQHPACRDVEEVLDTCGGLVTFLKGAP